MAANLIDSINKLAITDIRAARDNSKSSLAYEATCGKIFTVTGYEVQDSTATPIIEITPSKLLECINLISGPGSSHIYRELKSLENAHNIPNSCHTIEIECTPNGQDIITEGCWSSIDINAIGCLHDLLVELN